MTNGDLVRLSSGSAYGKRVAPRDTVKIVYVTDNGTQKVLDQWEGGGGGISDS